MGKSAVAERVISKSAAKTGASRARSGLELGTTRPGTPGGRFMRRFWMAVHRSQDLPAGRALPIRIMSEDYTLYRSEAGEARVIDYRCPHRGAQMHLGRVEGEGIRCVYHGWKFDGGGQCIEQPAEEAGFARKIRTRVYPTREFMGLIYAYFGDDEAPAFPPFPAPREEGLVDVWEAYRIPCNYLQSFENSTDEVHVAFVHAPGGSHAKIGELPLITAEETDWGMLRFGTRSGGRVRHTLHYMPGVTRVLVPPLAGMDGVGGWVELYFHWTPIDDENHLWLLTTHVKVTGKEAEAFLAKKAEYLDKLGQARPVMDVVEDLWSGRLRYEEVRHPDLAIVQDIATQAGQGRIAARDRDRLGRSDNGIILWRKILTRELRAIAEGRSPKQWKTAPTEVVPTLGF